jgi:hypothetical protein
MGIVAAGLAAIGRSRWGFVRYLFYTRIKPESSPEVLPNGRRGGPAGSRRARAAAEPRGHQRHQRVKAMATLSIATPSPTVDDS